MPSTIREWPEDDRPRERLTKMPAHALATRELLAIILGSGAAGRSSVDLAGELLSLFGGSLRRLGSAEPGELTVVRGIGQARACAVTATFELGRRMSAETARRGMRIRGPRDVYRRLGPVLRDRRQEEFWVVYLDTQNRILNEKRLTVGLLNSSLVHPREVFAPAIARSAASLILAHNHPSGDAEPSPEDLEVTLQLVESGRLLGIPVRDHVVIGDGSFVSLLERGLISTGSGGQAPDSGLESRARGMRTRSPGSKPGD